MQALFVPIIKAELRAVFFAREERNNDDVDSSVYPFGVYGGDGRICLRLRARGYGKSDFLRGQAHAHCGTRACPSHGRDVSFVRHDVREVFEIGGENSDETGFRHGDREYYVRIAAGKGAEMFYFRCGNQKQRKVRLRNGCAARRFRGDSRNIEREPRRFAAGHAER